MTAFEYIDSILTEIFVNNNSTEKSDEFNLVVQCYVGASRSVSMVIGYLMLKLKAEFEDCLEFVKLRRRQASPNEGFREQLKKFEGVVEEYWKKVGEWDGFICCPEDGGDYDEEFLVEMIGREICFETLREVFIQED
jgi:hypothetical protein